MKIGWIHDHRTSEVPDGGAQLTNDELVNGCPHDIQFLTPHDVEVRGTEYLKEFDILILNNIKFFTRPHLQAFVEHPRTVKYERDYWNYADPNHAPFVKPIMEGSFLNIFYSEGQLGEFMRFHKEVEFPEERVRFFYAPVNPKVFYDFGEARRNVFVHVSSIVPHKGIQNVLQYAAEHLEDTFEFYGRGNPDFIVQMNAAPNCQYMGVAPNSEMPAVYNNAKHFIFLPNWYEPFGRTVVEARLCGCELHMNERVGATEKEWFWDYGELVKKMETAVEDFWRMIEEGNK